jgi:hypothetical protein
MQWLLAHHFKLLAFMSMQVCPYDLMWNISVKGKMSERPQYGLITLFAVDQM